jgi:putative transposase
MDFMSDQFADRRRFRLLTLIDDYTRECLALDVASSIPGARVARVLERVAERTGYPEVIVMDNGPEFRSRALDAWAVRHGVKLHFIQPGKPNQNAYIESFNDKIRSECLNVNWFLGPEDARAEIERWRRDFNEKRPHSGVGRIPPAVFARRAAALPSPPAPSGLLHAQIKGSEKGESVL